MLNSSLLSLMKIAGLMLHMMSIMLLTDSTPRSITTRAPSASAGNWISFA
jgi:hypothetical protein